MSAAACLLHVLCQTGQLTVVCGIVPVVGGGQTVAVPVGLGQVFNLQYSGTFQVKTGFQSAIQRDLLGERQVSNLQYSGTFRVKDRFPICNTAGPFE